MRKRQKSHCNNTKLLCGRSLKILLAPLVNHYRIPEKNRGTKSKSLT